jgi:hypothetical protein
MIPFVYYWNNFLDREFQLPEDIVHFYKHIEYNGEPWNMGHCYGNSFMKKYGFGNTRKFGYKHLKGHAELEICVGVSVRKLFFDAINFGHVEEWKNWVGKNYGATVEPVPLVHFHAWNLLKGKVIDITYGKHHSEYEYLGFVVPDQIGRTFRDAPCVRSYLDKVFNLDPSVRYVRREGEKQNKKRVVLVD